MERVAESIRPVDVDRLPIPVVVARADGVTWQAGDNNHPYLLAVRRGARTCVGFGFLDGCGQRGGGAQRGPVVPRRLHGPRCHLAGRDAGWRSSTQPGGRIGEVATTTTSGFDDRFYAVPTGAAVPATAVVHDGDGNEIDRFALSGVPLVPSALPSGVDGVVVSVVAEGSTNGGHAYRISVVPRRTATAASGTPGSDRPLLRARNGRRRLSGTSAAGHQAGAGDGAANADETFAR